MGASTKTGPSVPVLALSLTNFGLKIQFIKFIQFVQFWMGQGQRVRSCGSVRRRRATSFFFSIFFLYF